MGHPDSYLLGQIVVSSEGRSASNKQALYTDDEMFSLSGV